MQPKVFIAAQPVSMSEDCLTLNIWAPRHAAKAPVMVWIHGGAFLEGSGALPVYAETAFARQGLIVGTINYRLGDFGIFGHPELTHESGSGPAANLALMDQIAALRWVRQNIAAFGGDPASVTIFGESAGGTSVDYLMVSPPARGLFQRAISQSGGGRSRAPSLSALELAGTRKAKEWGAADLKALRALPAETILACPPRLALGAYGPAIDGKYVLESPAEAFAAGRQAPVPFLLGANSFEASLMSAFHVTTEAVMVRVQGNADQVRQFYGDDPEKAAQDLFTDGLFLAPRAIWPHRWRECTNRLIFTFSPT